MISFLKSTVCSSRPCEQLLGRNGQQCFSCNKGIQSRNCSAEQMSHTVQSFIQHNCPGTYKTKQNHLGLQANSSRRKKADALCVTELQYVLTEQKSLFVFLIRLMLLCAYGSAQLLHPAVAKLRRCMEGSVMSQHGLHMTFNPGL